MSDRNHNLRLAKSLACECLRLNAANPSIIAALARPSVVDAAIALVELERHQSVLPALAWTLLRMNNNITARPHVAERLRDVLAANAAQNNLLLADLVELTTALEGAGVRTTVMKGAALLASSPLAVLVRHTDDIDLLIGEEDDDLATVARARDVVGRLGYRERRFAPTFDHHGTPTRSPYHVPPLVSARGTQLELHFRSGLSRAERTRLGTRRVNALGAAIEVPSSDALRVELSRHVIFQHGALPRYLPRHVVDLSLLDCDSDQDDADKTRSDVRDSALWIARSLAWSSAQPIHSRWRRLAETVLFPDGRITNGVLRALHLATAFEGRGAHAWVARLFPSRTYLSQRYPEAAFAPPLQLVALYARRLMHPFSP